MAKITPRVYPKHIDGYFRRLRNVVSFALQLLLFVTPWITLEGRPIVQLDIRRRVLHFMGWTFWPDDSYLLVFLLLSAFFALFFVTSLFGRVWCGYACPQTLFSQSFIRVERFFQGDRIQRMRLAQQSWTQEKSAKYLATYIVQIGMSLFLGLTFAGYYYSMDWLLENLLNPQALEAQSAWTIIFFFAAISLLFFGFLRERFCHTMCPYARLQGAMFDEDTLVVGYDYKRGEPRGKLKDPKANDCIDCGVCVDVCPVGIDIRDGLQFECIACAACIDGCDSIMDKVGQPKGLVRYCSERELEGEATRWNRPRPWVYGVLFVFTLSALLMGIYHHSPIEASFHRQVTGSVTQHNQEGQPMNIFELRLTNKSYETKSFRVQSQHPDIGLVLPQNPFEVEGLTQWKNPVYLVYLGSSQEGPGVVKLQILDDSSSTVLTELEVRFLGGV